MFQSVTTLLGLLFTTFYARRTPQRLSFSYGSSCRVSTFLASGSHYPRLTFCRPWLSFAESQITCTDSPLAFLSVTPRSEDDRFPHVLSSFPSDFPFAHVFLLVFAASFIHLIPNPQHNSLFNHSISFFVLVRLLLLLSPCVFPSSLCLCFNIVYHNSVPSFLCLSAHALRPPARVVNFSFSALVISSAAVWLLFLVSNK